MAAVLQGRLRGDGDAPAAVDQRLGVEEVLREVDAERLQAADLVEGGLPQEGRHAGVAVYPEHVRGEVHPRLHRPEEDLLVGGGEALAVAGEWHLVDQADPVRHVLDHVEEGVLLHAYAAVADEHQLVLGGLVRRLHVVDLRIHPHLGAADEERGLDFRILVDELAHQHQHRVGLVLDAEQELVPRILHGEEGLEVAEEIRIDPHEGLDHRDPRQRRLVARRLVRLSMQLPAAGDQRQHVHHPHARPEYHEEYREPVESV